VSVEAFVGQRDRAHCLLRDVSTHVSRPVYVAAAPVLAPVAVARLPVLWRDETVARGRRRPRLVDSVPDVLATRAPLDALRQWFTTLATYVRIKRGLGEALHSAAAQEVVSGSWPPVTAAVAQLLDACERAGEVRPGIDPVDVIMLMSCLWRTPDNPDGAAQADRLLELAIDGFRP
jgi:hypothetical protein